MNRPLDKIILKRFSQTESIDK